MPIHKSQKGRGTAAQLTAEKGRRKSGVRAPKLGGQQFGGVGQRMDEDVRRLSSRARRALLEKKSR